MDDMHDMVAKLNWYGQFYTKEFPDRAMPMVFIVDSISGLAEKKAREEAQKGEVRDNKMEAAQNAQTLTKGIRTFNSEYLYKHPFLVIMITHQKKKIADASFGPSWGNNMDMGTGGVHKDFQATWRLVIDAVKRHPPSKDEVNPGRRVDHSLKADKCGMGEDHRRILYTTHAFVDEEGDSVRMDFDFDSALIRLLVDDKITGKRFLQSKIGLVKKASDAFDIGSLKLKGLTMREAGKAINNSPKLIKELQRYFRISHHAVFGQKLSHDPEVADISEDDDDSFD